MKIADLVDLEWLVRDGADVGDVAAAAAPAVQQVLRRRGLDAAAAHARLDVDRPLREELALAALAAARARTPDLPGRRVGAALRWLAVLLVLFGLLLGFGTARTVLHYDGTVPVNVLSFVAVFVALQIVLLALLLWVFLSSHHHAPGGVGFLAWLFERLLALLGRASKGAATFVEQVRALRTRHSLYGDVERWSLFSLGQAFGFSFNVAALAATLLLVTGTDLVFSWSTTLDVDARTVHALARTIALPWAFFEDGVPSLAAVEASRWVRMPGAFVNNGSVAHVQLLAAQWWPFLVCGLVAYGLLPRGCALLFGTWRRRRALRATGLDHAGFHALYQRLLPADLVWTGPAASDVRGAPPAADGVWPATPRAPVQPGASAALLCWGSLGRDAAAARSLAESRLLVRTGEPLRVGGADLAADAAALREVRSRAPQRAVVAFAAGQQPTADVLAFVRDLRAALGPAKPIVVLLAEPRADGTFAEAEAGEHAIWRRSLGALGDAHLWLQTLEPQR